MAKRTKKQIKELSERLGISKKTVWGEAGAAERKKIMSLGEEYKGFLDACKTERMAVKHIIAQARKKGFKPLGGKADSKRYYTHLQGKVVALIVMGKRPPSQGVRILGAHLDAPRLDLKQLPLYESEELAFLKTHYYGGIKKYQWLARPLAIHGVVCTAGGKSVEIHIGDDPGDPVFSVLDLLPHLSRKAQGGKKLSDAFEGERMNLLVGGNPIDGEGDSRVKLAVLEYLSTEYDVCEADLISAELEIVPAGLARDVGFDRSMIGAYGQDDRSSSFAAVQAALQAANPAVTSLVLLFDKEEIGSDGATGAQSHFLELLMAEVIKASGERPSYLKVARALAASQALSADVTAAFDPDYPEVHEKRNAAFMGHGVALHKYTGSGGKYGASDANAEYMAWVRGVWESAGVVWQAAGMGKIDEGGGGTIAKYLAMHTMEIVDTGPPVLSMHSPFEISHKADIYSTCNAFRAFLQAKAR